MKYWRGYLVAAIIAACTWALREFAAAHTVLVDMVYPYVTRIIQSYLAEWSSGVTFCIWQTALLVLVALGLASIVLMVVLKWNPIQWFGWVLTAVSVVFFLHTGIYGLNEFAGSIADDVRMNDAEYAYTVTELEQAAVYYREYANALSNQVERDDAGQVADPGFQAMAEQAADGFETLTYERHYAVFAGSTLPVKEMTFSSNKDTGMTVALTGESSVNPELPTICMPFAMCHEMAHRMCIAVDKDADFAAFLACSANSSKQFQYSGYLMAYRACYNALEAISKSTGSDAPQKLAAGESEKLRTDMQTYNAYFGNNQVVDGALCDLLVVWHIQTVVLPAQEIEEEVFDPMDESQVDLTTTVIDVSKEETAGNNG